MTADPEEQQPRVGLARGKRYRCGSCGNLTRFDVEVVEHTRRYWHADLAGGGVVEDEEPRLVEVRSVICRWCGAAEAVEVIDAPSP